MTCEGRACGPWHVCEGQRKIQWVRGLPSHLQVGSRDGILVAKHVTTAFTCWAILLDFTLSFVWNFHVVSMVADIFTSPPTLYKGPVSPLQSWKHFFFLDNSHSDGAELESQCGFNLISFIVKGFRCFPHHIFIGYLYFFW